MASSDQNPAPVAAKEGTPQPPGKPMTMAGHVLDKGSHMLQSLKPLKQISQHTCSFALYSHDLSRQIQTHHFMARLNQDFLQCAVYDSDDSSAHLIGIEYIVSERIFEALPEEEQKLWHSHAHEVRAGLWMSPRMPELVVKPELEDMARTYGKFWCTWQVDRGDKLPMGAPALMMSPQAESPGRVPAEIVRRRDEKYKVSTKDMGEARVDVEGPGMVSSQADYWMKHPGKGFAIDIA